ncbi:Chain_A [Hexamita inflata]|uniref:Leucine Rich Repeat Protein n=1 Tax=Hexamita inflata TaxID=28002 RepID=A0AA86Q4V3_9EUKA|nr:Chain A [Hexamita inflata]CAI9949668.1 Chain A [Hexamita inflata]
MLLKYKNKVTDDGYLEIIENKYINSIQFTEQLEVTDLYIDLCYELKFSRISTKITKLEVHNCNTKTIDGIENMKQLNTLIISAEKLNIVAKIRYLDNLSFLELKNSSICDIFPLQNLCKLQHLDLSQNCINDVQSLSKLVNLMYLKLHRNNIYKLMYLANLEHLDLSSNQITNIFPIRFQKSLLSLNLSKNNITCIKSLQQHVQLKKLDISHNYIQQFKYIQNHQNFDAYIFCYQRKSEQYEQLSKNVHKIYFINGQLKRNTFLVHKVIKMKTKFGKRIERRINIAINNLLEFSKQVVSLFEQNFCGEQ